MLMLFTCPWLRIISKKPYIWVRALILDIVLYKYPCIYNTIVQVLGIPHPYNHLQRIHRSLYVYVIADAYINLHLLQFQAVLVKTPTYRGPHTFLALSITVVITSWFLNPCSLWCAVPALVLAMKVWYNYYIYISIDKRIEL